MTQDELTEALADKEHASWARWMQYLFSKCEHSPGGSLIIPSGYVAALQKQINTPYADLADQEKQYDRDEVAHILPIIEEYAHNKKEVNIEEAVYLALGEASMCWSEVPQGVFDSTKAKDIGEHLLQGIRKYKGG